MYIKQKKKGKKRGEKKRGFWGPRQRREELFPFVNRFVLSFLTKEEEGRARARTHTQRVCVSERACFALEKESGCKRGRVLLEGEKEREEKVRGERARKNRSFLNALVAVL